ncbi:unnamed protein product [Allacma fusca]|uniref:Enkurin domain-containing protein n=1 Tax=Allacma fusca TaxID=39272 RepID=A0A8J2LPT1_9HEXA|nr:unnamed protein product [Allacma fusca]
MYTICDNKCHEECVYNLIKRPEYGASKPPMHTSRYASMVRKQSMCNKKGCNRTMGPAIVPLCPPEHFLRKHSRAPISLRPPAVPQVQLCPVPVQTAEDIKDVEVEVKVMSKDKVLGVNDQPKDDPSNENSGKDDCKKPASRTSSKTNTSNTCSFSNAAQAGSTCPLASDSRTKLPTIQVYTELVPPTCPQPQVGGNGATRCPQICCKRRIPRLCCNTEKPAVPPVCCGRCDIIPRGCKDYIKNNAVKVIRQPAKIPQARYVDQAKGTTYDWCPSGYPRKYVFRQDYGMVPGYIVERKNELESKFQQEKYASEQGLRDASERCRHLEESDRQALICGLKTNWEQVYNEYQQLPLNVDTVMRIRTKLEFEQTMKDIEKDIQLLERHNHIFLADANKSFYMA